MEDVRKNNLERPPHYCDIGGIEPIKYIVSHGLDFNLGNVIKYVTRAGHKEGNSTLQDLKKARVYIDFAISAEETGGIPDAHKS